MRIVIEVVGHFRLASLPSYAFYLHLPMVQIVWDSLVVFYREYLLLCFIVKDIKSQAV